MDNIVNNIQENPINYSNIDNHQRWCVDSHGTIRTEEKKGFFGRIFSFFRSESTKLDKVFAAMLDDIDAIDDPSKTNCQDLLYLCNLVEERYSKAARAGVIVAGHGDAEANKEAILNASYQKLGGVIFGDPNWKANEEISEDERAVLASIYSFLNSTGMNRADIEEFTQTIVQQFPDLQDENTSANMYMRMAELGFPAAQVIAYSIEQDAALRIGLLNAASDSGCLLATRILENQLRDMDDADNYPLIHQLTEKLADHDLNARFRLAFDHLTGCGTEIDIDRALEIAEGNDREDFERIQNICQSLKQAPQEVTRQTIRTLLSDLTALIPSANGRRRLLEQLVNNYPLVHLVNALSQDIDLEVYEDLIAQGFEIAREGLADKYLQLARYEEAFVTLWELAENDAQAMYSLVETFGPLGHQILNTQVSLELLRKFDDRPLSDELAANFNRLYVDIEAQTRVIALANRLDRIKDNPDIAPLYVAEFHNYDTFMTEHEFSDDMKAEVKVAFMYQYGIGGVSENIPLARLGYKHLARSIYEQAHQFMREGEYDKALRFMERAAKLGNIEACYQAVRMRQLNLTGDHNPKTILDLIHHSMIDQTQVPGKLRFCEADTLYFDYKDMGNSIDAYIEAATLEEPMALKVLHELVDAKVIAEKDIPFETERLLEQARIKTRQNLTVAASTARSDYLSPGDALTMLESVVTCIEISEELKSYAQNLLDQEDVAVYLNDVLPFGESVLLANLATLMAAASVTEATEGMALERVAKYLFNMDRPTEEEIEIARSLRDWAVKNKEFFQAGDLMRKREFAEAQHLYAALAAGGDHRGWYPAARLLELGFLGDEASGAAVAYYNEDLSNVNSQYALALYLQKTGQPGYEDIYRSLYEDGYGPADIQLALMAEQELLFGLDLGYIDESVENQRSKIGSLLEYDIALAQRGETTILRIANLLSYLNALDENLVVATGEAWNSILNGSDDFEQILIDVLMTYEEEEQ